MSNNIMWFNYQPTSGVQVHYTDLNGIEKTYQTNFSTPEKVIRMIAMLAHNNEIGEITCVGLAYDLAPAIKEQLIKTYNNESVKFIKGE